MTKTSIALTELAEKGANVDLVRDMLQFAAQRLMDMDVEEVCGAAYGERGGGRQNARNGYRDRLWDQLCAALPETEESNYPYAISESADRLRRCALKKHSRPSSRKRIFNRCCRYFPKRGGNCSPCRRALARTERRVAIAAAVHAIRKIECRERQSGAQALRSDQRLKPNRRREQRVHTPRAGTRSSPRRRTIATTG
jgi:hypothetical protein